GRPRPPAPRRGTCRGTSRARRCAAPRKATRSSLPPCRSGRRGSRAVPRRWPSRRSVASARMKVLHLASANRWTGAAAPAFAEAEALRAAGIDAHFAYVGGYKLEAKLAHVDFAHPVIARHQNPASFLRSVDAIERLIRHHRFDF